MRIEFNINHKISIDLTDRGVEHLRRQIDSNWRSVHDSAVEGTVSGVHIETSN